MSWSRSLLAILLLTLPGTASAAKGDCAQPLSSGTGPTTRDCLYILKTAVGSRTCSPACICDVNASGTTTTLDALLCLKKTVGQDVTLSCGASCKPTTTTSSTTTTTSTIASTSMSYPYDVACQTADCDAPRVAVQQRTQTPLPAR